MKTPKFTHGLVLGLAALLLIAAATVGPFTPSPFTTRTGTNTTAAAWRTALGAAASSAGAITNGTFIGGTMSGVTNSDLTAARVMVSGATGIPTNSSVTSATLLYLDTTSSVQTQLDAKASLTGLSTLSNAVSSVSNSVATVSNSVTTLQAQLPGYVTNLGGLATNLTATGLTVAGGQTNSHLTASRALATDANKALVSSATTATELGYVAGVTSAIQTQPDASASGLLSVSNTVSTNTVTLNATQTVAGPKSFTNAANVFAGDGSALTGLVASAYLPLAGGSPTGAILSSSSMRASFFRGDMLNSYDNGYTLFSLDTGDGRLRLYGNGDNVLYVTSTNLTQRNGAVSQSFTTFNSYTDTANYQGFRISQTSAAASLAAIVAGTNATNVNISLLPAGSGGVVIGASGTPLKQLLSATATLDFDLTAVVVQDLTVTCTGALVGDVVSLGVPHAATTNGAATVTFHGWVSAADTVTVRATTAAAGENPSSATFRVAVQQY